MEDENPMQLIRRCFLFLLPVLFLGAVAAQNSAPAVSVQGDVQKPGRWSMEELRAQFASQVQNVNFTAGKDKQPKAGTGIPLAAVIRAAELKTEKSISHHDLKFLVILEAKDGYQAFFSLAELTPSQGQGPQAFLVWEINGKPLPEKEAPLRLVLTNAGEARQIHAVHSITLVDGVKLANQLKRADR
jgi:DMSO/TMAO reductase YedYZ molybdopterin-dependent catalytic subunit